jgi:hypothetical protein
MLASMGGDSIDRLIESSYSHFEVKVKDQFSHQSGVSISTVSPHKSLPKARFPVREYRPPH